MKFTKHRQPALYQKHLENPQVWGSLGLISGLELDLTEIFHRILVVFFPPQCRPSSWTTRPTHTRTRALTSRWSVRWPGTRSPPCAGWRTERRSSPATTSRSWWVQHDTCLCQSFPLSGWIVLAMMCLNPRIWSGQCRDHSCLNLQWLPFSVSFNSFFVRITGWRESTDFGLGALRWRILPVCGRERGRKRPGNGSTHTPRAR